ncbi:catecholate siderophore receptor Fiu [Comamonas terrigena]|uniref:catecholate siderophore receptor Fiu n=1 Tax=Comamonas terrigena TaxID=32013 RepID=UPI00244AB687|nr:catecholate siderophore receptor Fiu [Comamonas terrigena]MDH1701539.1 catecholate siderophore receptor Fiu [Comamonas terrigena]
MAKNLHIKSRKHASTVQRAPAAGVVAAAAIATFGLSAQAQTTSADTPALKEVRVQSTQDSGYTPGTPSSPKFTQPQVNTTQTMSIIRSEVLKEQGATTLTEALRNVPGVGTFNIGENGRMNTGDSVSMRGFDTSDSIFVDGVRDLGGISRDIFNTEQVEVFKGPAGTDNGRTSASGSINLVTKQPRLEDSFSASVGAGSAKYKRTTADWNKQLTGLPGAAFRLNVMGEDSGTPGRDVVENKKWGIAPSLALGLGTDSRIFLNYLHVKQNNLPDGGVPVIGLPGYNAASTLSPAVRQYLNTHRVNSSNFYGSVSDFDDTTVDMFTAKVERDLSAGTTLQNITRVGRTEQLFTATRPNAITSTAADPANWTISRGSNSADTSNKIITNQTNLTTKLTAGGLEHSISAGVELTREEAEAHTLAGGDYASTTTNLWNPNPHVSRTALKRNGGYSERKIDTISLYGFDTIKLNEQWAINGGLRADHYKLHSTSQTVASGTTPATFIDVKNSDTLWNWKLGVLFKPATNGSIYANYALQQQPPGTVTGGDGAGGGVVTITTSASDINSFFRNPQKTKTFEVGTKWELAEKRLLLTGAVFHTELNNQISCDYLGNTASNCVQDGKKTVKGLELGAVGQITNNWQVTTGLTLQRTHTDASRQRGTGTISADGSNDLPFTPRTAFTLWSSYKVMPALTIGAGGRYMGSMKKSNDGNVTGPATIGAYWVFDAMATYQVSKNVSLKFNVNNLFDKDYVASINRGGNRYFPGAERSYRLTANFDF